MAPHCDEIPNNFKENVGFGAKIYRHTTREFILDISVKDRSFTTPVRDAVFAMVANRALAPCSKLAVEEWAEHDVYLGFEKPIQVQHLYRSMDFLFAHADTIQKKVFWETAHLRNLTVDLIFFDTTNTYFEMEKPWDSELLAYGKSKHKRNDLPQVTIGLAVTREGIPVRCWVLPGNQNDAKCVKQIQRDMNDWKLGNVISRFLGFNEPTTVEWEVRA